MDSIKKNFGSKLRDICKIRGFTQEKFAEKIEINLRQLARIEAGESFVTSQTLAKICLVLEVSPAMLFDFEIYTECLKTGTDNITNFKVIKSGNIVHLVKEEKKETPKFNLQERLNEIDNNMKKIAKRLGKDITVEEIENGEVKATKIYKPDGEIETQTTSSAQNGYEILKNKIEKISSDSMKIDFMNLAYDSLNNIKALCELKTLMKGIELTLSSNV